MAMIGAFLGGPDTTLPVGKAGISLCVNTTDRQNLATASFTVTASGLNKTVQADASGRGYIEVDAGKTYTVTLNHQGSYENDDPQTVIAESRMQYGVLFDLFDYPAVSTMVTVSASFNGLGVEGVSVVATMGLETITGTTGANGQAVLRGLDIGTWTISLPDYDLSQSLLVDNLIESISFSLGGINVSLIGGSTAVTVSGQGFSETRTLDSGGTGLFGPVSKGQYTVSTAYETKTVTVGSTTIAVTILGKLEFKFTMSLNSTTMQTDPTGCFTYGDDAAGFTPLSNTRATLGTVTTVGSWGFRVNKLLKKMYYATFNTDGSISKILDPDNLALDEDGNASDITTKNTMLVIPKVYTKGESGKLTISDKASEGTAHAHTIGGVEYDNLALGVYNGYVSGSKLMSLSGVLPTKSQTRAVFRTQAQANGTNWMLWNYHQWRLIRDICFFAAKSFDGQRKLGQGGHAYGSNTTGVTNAMGPFAGDVSGTSSAMKFLLEDWWGSQYQFIDDFYGNGGTYYAGQNAIPTDNSSNKVNIEANSSQSGYSKTILQGDLNWGLGNADNGGSNAVGLCDGQWFSTSELLGRVGGYSGNASDGYAGPSCLSANADLSFSGAKIGARLAFVFND